MKVAVDHHAHPQDGVFLATGCDDSLGTPVDFTALPRGERATGTRMRYVYAMPTAIPEPEFVANGDVRLAVYCWGNEPSALPKLLLSHGTGFCGPMWHHVAEALRSEFIVYAIDRRGHGRSTKPDDSYHFLDFAEDIVAVIDALQLEGAYAVGHSAGATDLLLATVQRPGAFRSIFAMEPTVMHRTQPEQRIELRAKQPEQLRQVGRRRSTFACYDDVVKRYRTRPAFQAWQPELLQTYARYGFEPCDDGSVQLRCAPALERAMLVHIYAAMAGDYAGDHRGMPFDALAGIACPTCITTAERSGDIYKQMARVAVGLIPDVQTHHFETAGHSVPQERPDQVASALRTFWHSPR